MKTTTGEMGNAASNGRWIGCLACDQPLQISLTFERAVFACQHCSRQFVVKREVVGGEVGGLPPFLAREEKR